MLALRLARPEDCATIIALVNQSNGGLARIELEGMAEPGEDWIAAGVRLLARRDVEFSYTNTFIAEWDGEVAGMRMYCVQANDLPPPDLSQLPRNNHAFAVLRARVPGHLYLSNIAVFPAFRGRGIGRALIDATLQAAMRIGIARVAAVVHESNALVLDQYRRRGLVEIGRHKVLDHPQYPAESDWLLLAGETQRALNPLIAEVAHGG